MIWFNNLALAKKLAAAFGLCTLITLGVGAVGMSGLQSLNALLDALLNNNLRSITQLNDAKSNVIGHNRDLFRLVSMTYANAPQADQEHIIALAEVQPERGGKALRRLSRDPAAGR